MEMPTTAKLMLADDLYQRLHREAVAAREQAYAPYSKYAVGASLLASSGVSYAGANVENAAYPDGMCAERAALFAAVSNGERAFEAIVIVTENGGAPCGSCRQALSEFGVGLQVITADLDGKAHLNCSLEDLLPHSFGPADLPGG